MSANWLSEVKFETMSSWLYMTHIIWLIWVQSFLQPKFAIISIMSNHFYAILILKRVSNWCYLGGARLFFLSNQRARSRHLFEFPWNNTTEVGIHGLLNLRTVLDICPQCLVSVIFENQNRQKRYSLILITRDTFWFLKKILD